MRPSRKDCQLTQPRQLAESSLGVSKLKERDEHGNERFDQSHRCARHLRPWREIMFSIHLLFALMPRGRSGLVNRFSRVRTGDTFVANQLRAASHRVLNRDKESRDRQRRYIDPHFHSAFNTRSMDRSRLSSKFSGIPSAARAVHTAIVSLLC